MGPWSGHIVGSSAMTEVRVHVAFKLLIDGVFRIKEVVRNTYAHECIWEVCCEELLDDLFDRFGECTVIIEYMPFDAPSPALE